MQVRSIIKDNPVLFQYYFLCLRSWYMYCYKVPIIRNIVKASAQRHRTGRWKRKELSHLVKQRPSSRESNFNDKVLSLQPQNWENDTVWKGREYRGQRGLGRGMNRKEERKERWKGKEEGGPEIARPRHWSCMNVWFFFFFLMWDRCCHRTDLGHIDEP